jgi:hypothetical protein
MIWLFSGYSTPHFRMQGDAPRLTPAANSSGFARALVQNALQRTAREAGHDA